MSTKPQSHPLPDYSEIASVETITGLVARYIPPTEAQLQSTAPDPGQPFRCQIGKRSVMKESAILPGKETMDNWVAEYFHPHFIAGSWGDVITNWKRGERARA